MFTPDRTVSVDSSRGKSTMDTLSKATLGLGGLSTMTVETSPADENDMFACTLLKSDARAKYGLAYRVFNASDVVITGVLGESAAEEWNADADPSTIICTGDTIIQANSATLARPIVDELLGSLSLNMMVRKTGPRWHITGDDLGRKASKNLAAGSFAVKMGSQGVEQDQTKGDVEYGESDISQGVDRLSTRSFLLMTVASFLPNLIVLACFSNVGIGLKVFNFFCKPSRNDIGNGVVAVGSFVLVAMVLLDWSQWQSKIKKVLLLTVTAYVICLGAILKSLYYPFAPFVIVLFHVPVLLGVLRATICKTVASNNFYSGVSVNLFGCTFFVIAIWLVWMNIDGWDGSHRWNDATKDQLVMDSETMYTSFEVTVNGRKRPLNYWWDCENDLQMTVDYETIETFRYPEGAWTASSHKFSSKEKETLSTACARVKTIWFLVWASPLICAGVNFIIAIFGCMNSFLLNVHDTSKLEKVMKQFILMISFLVFTMYVSTSVAGASMRLTGVIMAFCASGLIALFVWLYMEIGRKAITSTVRKSKLMQSLIALATSDWVRAMVLIGLNVLIPSFLIINILNQKVRKIRGIARNPEDRYTQGMQAVIMACKSWNWASILIKTNWLVVLYWTLSVGVAKLTYIFLSWLNETLLQIPFVAVIIIFFIIGFTMFMLPPVPGIPVYICSGIVLSARARNIEAAGKFWGGMCIAIVESLILKLCAVCGQYYIGYFLGKSVKVQQLVAVDKVFTRSIEQILNVRGLNLPKVSVLVGGPDWPTSVLCGILRLSLFQCCLGTLPVIFVSAPCVVAGAFMANPGKTDDDTRRLDAMLANETSNETSFQSLQVGKVGKGEIWDTLSTTALAVSFLLQLAGMVLALYFIQEVIYKNGEDLAKPREEHEAVAALTRAEADYVKIYADTLSWNQLDKSRKYIILAATAMMLMSTFLFVMMDEVCFRQFQVSNKISDPYDEDGLDGNVLNIVMLPGWIATFLFFGACALHFAFLRWAGSEAKKRLADKELKAQQLKGLTNGRRSDSNNDG